MLANASAGLSRPIFLLRPERLPPDLLTRVTHRNLAAKEVLYHRGDKAVAVFAVERGRLQLFSYTSEGKPVPLYVIRPGECVAEAALFADHYCGDVVAEVPSRVAMFPKGPLLQAFHERPALSDDFMARLTRRFNLLRIRLELRTVQSARERVLQYIRWIASPDQESILVDRPLKSIAEDLGLTHESFYRTLSQLVREGAIVRQKGRIHLKIASPYDPDHGSFAHTALSFWDESFS